MGGGSSHGLRFGALGSGRVAPRPTYDNRATLPVRGPSPVRRTGSAGRCDRGHSDAGAAGPGRGCVGSVAVALRGRPIA